MARRSNSTPPAASDAEGGVAVADSPAGAPLEVPVPSPATTPSASSPKLELLEQLPDENPRLSELGAALGDTPAEGAGASSSSSSSGAPADPSSSSSYRRPDFKRWSANRSKKASRKELVDRVRELEAIAETTPPADKSAGAPAAEAPAISPEQLIGIATASLTATFRVVSGIGARMRGPHWQLTDEETGALAGAWAPVIAPHLGQLVEYLPIVGAVAVTVEVVLPRIERDMQLAKAAGAESIEATVSAQHATE